MAKMHKIISKDAKEGFRNWNQLMLNTRAELDKLRKEFQMRDEMIREEMSKQARVHYTAILTSLGVVCPDGFETGEWYLNSDFYEDFGDAYLIHDPEAKHKTEVQKHIMGLTGGSPEVETDGRPN